MAANARPCSNASRRSANQAAALHQGTASSRTRCQVVGIGSIKPVQNAVTTSTKTAASGRKTPQIQTKPEPDAVRVRISSLTETSIMMTTLYYKVTTCQEASLDI